MFRKSSNCIRDRSLDVTPQQVDEWIHTNQHSKPELAGLFKKHLSQKPVANWLGDWNPNPRQRVRELIDHAQANNALFQIVLYNIPHRDFGGFSAGGSQSREAYLSWVNEITMGIGSAEGIIIIEPDALPHANEFDQHRKEQRLATLREAVTNLRKICKNAHIYLDAGHPNWLPASIITELLLKAGIRSANGISLNISNSQMTEDCYRYGLNIVENISAEHGIIIDTSRNGAGPPSEDVTSTDAWANPSSSRLGQQPTLRVSLPNIFSSRLHGLLWVKPPGESDGSYNGAPPAGEFWPEGAMCLIDEQSWKTFFLRITTAAVTFAVHRSRHHHGMLCSSSS